MPQLALQLKYKKNQGIALSATELIEGYFFGIPLTNRFGQSLSPKVIEDKIMFAQAQVEDILGIKLSYTLMKENRDYLRGDYETWGFLKMGFPVVQALSLNGQYGNTPVQKWPTNWMTVSKNSEEYLIGRSIHIVPNGNGTIQANGFIGIFPQLGFLAQDFLPNYWIVQYLTGMGVIRGDLLDFIGKLAAIPLLAMLGDIVLGPGLTSQSLSFDGLSQTTTTTKSATSSAYSARINQYINDLKYGLPTLVNTYKGIAFNVL